MAGKIAFIHTLKMGLKMLCQESIIYRKHKRLLPIKKQG